MKLTLNIVVGCLALFCGYVQPVCAKEAAGSIKPVQGDWPAYGQGADEQHASGLAQINATNVGGLGLVWSQDLPQGTTVSQPIEAQGRIFTATGHSLVSAFDAVTGKLLWRYDSGAAERAGYKLRNGFGSKGLAYADGRVVVATHDGRLVSLSAADGSVVWSVQTTEPDDMRFISGAPRVFAGRVLIGHGGSDGGNARGYVTCYDAATGRFLWRFYLAPGDPALGPDHAASDSIMPAAAKTWSGTWWQGGGGGTAWNALTYDSQLNRFYIGTGNAFAYNRAIRSQGRGDNWFVASIVAVDADSGRYVWHYQTNPGDEWDYDACNDMTLAALRIKGTQRLVLMQASKNGFFYVIDRRNGRLISAEPYARQNWAQRIDTQTGRPVETAAARYHGSINEIWPSVSGAHNWLPQSFNSVTGLVYIPVIERAMLIGDRGLDLEDWRPPVHGVGGSGVTGDFNPTLPGARKAYLAAWDPVAQNLRWRVELPGDWPGGTMTTAGNLVFQGRIDHQFVAYAADTGRVLWTYDARSPLVAPPITFAVDGRQYVTILTGSGSAGGGPFSAGISDFGIDYHSMPRRVLTFALDGHDTLPPAPPPLKLYAPADPGYRPNPALEERGIVMFHTVCAGCHGMAAVAAGTAPDLRGSPIPLNADAFKAIVSDGRLVPLGMPQFPDLSAEDIEAIRQYVRTTARALPKAAGP